MWKLPQNIIDTTPLFACSNCGDKEAESFVICFYPSFPLPLSASRSAAAALRAACRLSPPARISILRQHFYCQSHIHHKLLNMLAHIPFNWGNLHFYTTSLFMSASMLSYHDVKTVCAKCDLFQLHIQAAAKPIITVELNSERAPLITRFCYNSSRLLW